jgi:glycosyltransferase involved in cell wall biosynthesis
MEPPSAGPLRIAMFTEAWPPIISGVSAATRTLVEGLRARGHTVDLYTPKHPERDDGDADIIGLPSVTIPMPGWIPITLPLTPGAFREICRGGYDIAHTQHPFVLGQTARALARRANIPLVGTMHTQYEQYVHYWSPWQEPGRRIVRQLVRDYCNTCDQVTTVAQGMADLLREYGVTTPIEVIPNDLDLSAYLTADGATVRQKLGLQNDEVMLLSLGRMGAEKNLVFMLDALTPVLREERVRLVFVGDGPLRPELERRALADGVAGRVVFAGPVPHDETPGWYAAADLFLLASVTEVNPLTVGEAMASGTPVVAVDSFSARDAVRHNENGLVVPAAATDFREAVHALVRDGERRRAMGACARETAARRGASGAAERTEALYRRLAGTGHAEGRRA